jgi:hypothetical protein
MSTNEPIPTFKPGIQKKIKKLLALGERGGTEAEAQAAMARAHVLLAKHNLTLSEVQAHGSEPEAPIETDESTPAPLRNKLWRDKPRHNFRYVYGWLSRPYADIPDRYLESPPQTSGYCWRTRKR